jgi:hypothetical protein
MSGIKFRSLEAVKFAQELMLEFERYKEADDLAREIRSEHSELMVRNQTRTLIRQVDARVTDMVERIDPRHRSREILLTHLYRAADEVVDNNPPGYLYRPNPFGCESN